MDSDSSYEHDDDVPFTRPRTPDASEAYKHFKATRHNLDEYPASDNDEEQEDIDDQHSSMEEDDDMAEPALEGGKSLDELYELIYKYSPIDIELDTHLEPFIPDFVPAIGDIDAFIKVPRPDGMADYLGLRVLDEPDINQSNPTILDMKLKSLSKSSIHPQSPNKVYAIHDTQALKSNPKPLNTWIQSLEELHATRPPAVVKYTRPMPDLEELMQAWRPEIEQQFKQIQLETGKHPELPLEDYVRFILAIMDIPLHSSQNTSKSIQTEKKNAQSRTLIESLHVLFSLYSAFQQSNHFN